ncbi:MAG: hypothetical protein H0X61_07500 [Acidimicrobiia bacterium]|jgi:hypothetical protein|nr:hypothetical protein [Acidimicrobiia bacterium]MBA3983368.1 hypothetical protein [Acidimicrobiia bacterium]MDQ3391195.1 hypothetical protein [Actinomycetota bacterium]
MNQSLPPPIGANRVDEPDDQDDGAAMSGASARIRLIAAALVLALAIGAGVIGYRVIAGDEGGSGGGGEVGSWNAIAVQDVEDGNITIMDGDGQELETFEVEGGAGSISSAGPYLLVDNDAPEVIDTRSGDRTALELNDGENARFISPPSPIVATSSPSGANVRIVDVDSGTEIDVAELGELTGPRIFLESAQFDVESGVIGLIDESTSQSVLIDVDGDDDPAFLPGRVVDVAFGRALAVQPAGPEAELRFYDVNGEELGTIDLPALRIAWLVDESTARVVTTGGDLLRVTVAGDDPEQLASLEMGEDGPAPFIELGEDLERLVFETSDERVVVVDWDGHEIGQAPGAIIDTALVSRMAQRCVAVIEADEENPTAPTRLLDAESGDTVGEPFEVVRLTPLVGSDDGCTVSTAGTEAPVVVHRDHVTELEVGPARVSPDGDSVIVRRDGQNLLQRASEQDDDPIELPAGLVVFVDRS